MKRHHTNLHELESEDLAFLSRLLVKEYERLKPLTMEHQEDRSRAFALASLFTRSPAPEGWVDRFRVFTSREQV